VEWEGGSVETQGLKIPFVIGASVGALLFALMVLGTALIFRPLPPTRITILDVRKPANVLLSGGNCGAHLSVRLHGEIDGYASVFISHPNVPHADTPFLSNDFTGRIDWNRASDWFGTNAELHYYVPRDVTTGSLVIEYENR